MTTKTGEIIALIADLRLWLSCETHSIGLMNAAVRVLLLEMNSGLHYIAVHVYDRFLFQTAVTVEKSV
jgi:hypothetical protein